MVVIEQMDHEIDLPRKNHTDDVGLDFTAIEDIYLKPGKVTVVSTRCKIQLPKNKRMLLKERSSLAAKMNVMAMAGIIDGG